VGERGGGGGGRFLLLLGVAGDGSSNVFLFVFSIVDLKFKFMLLK
jgi:hypothetical protein